MSYMLREMLNTAFTAQKHTSVDVIQYDGFVFTDKGVGKMGATELFVIEFALMELVDASPEPLTYFVIYQDAESLLSEFNGWLSGKDSLLVYRRKNSDMHKVSFKYPLILLMGAYTHPTIKIVGVDVYRAGKGLVNACD